MILKPHKLSVIYRLKKFLYILIIPFIYGAIDFFKNHKLTTSLILFFIEIILITAFYIFEWNITNLEIFDDKLILKYGVIIRRTKEISKDSVTSLTLKVTPLLLINHGAKVTCLVNAEKWKKRKFRLIIRRRDISKLRDFFNIAEEGEEVYKASFKDALFTSVTSGLSTKILFLFPILREARAFLSRNKNLYYKIDEDIKGLSKEIFYFLPSVIGFIMILFAILWIISVIVSILKIYGYSLYNSDGYYYSECGLIEREERYIFKNAISLIYLKQTPFNFIFNKKSVRFSSPAIYKYDLVKPFLIFPIDNKKAKRIFSKIAIYKK
jgi:hypothetical protein